MSGEKFRDFKLPAERARAIHRRARTNYFENRLGERLAECIYEAAFCVPLLEMGEASTEIRVSRNAVVRVTFEVLKKAATEQGGGT